ncbi:hypothetical protein CMV_012223 [Castanea mollissima]|uniref:Uncharacterized protein n=1 Tax=Castanea mollissima TaxID=60419 RepID=A0A8J4VZF6_9ROSI|nr:hypothetical protein CMV_012223 [Castanea mollissima]
MPRRCHVDVTKVPHGFSRPSCLAAFSFLQNADPRSVVPPHAKRSSTAPPSVQNAGHHQSFSSTTQRLHLLRHHPSPALHLSALPISHSQQFLPLSHPQFLSPTTLSTPGFLPPVKHPTLEAEQPHLNGCLSPYR